MENRQQTIRTLVLSIRHRMLATGESRFILALAHTAEQTPVIGTLQALELFDQCATKEPTLPQTIQKPWHLPQELYTWLNDVKEILSDCIQQGDQPIASTAESLETQLLEMLELCQPV